MIEENKNRQQLGMLLCKAGYRAVQRSINGVRGRGWIVYQRNTDEINALINILKDE